MSAKEGVWQFKGRLLCNECFTSEIFIAGGNLTATKANLSTIEKSERKCSKCGKSFGIKGKLAIANTSPKKRTSRSDNDISKKKPKLKSKTGTVLRQPGKATPITREKEIAEPAPLEIAEKKDWEVRSLPVWRPGDVILDTYEVEDVFSGGMGHVYIAHHNKWKVKLAIKSPNEMMLENKSNFARILREANSWTELGLHPNIAYCYYVRNIEDVPHIFVEYVDGGNLKEWIQEGKCIEYRTNLDLAIQFCHGMEHAHAKGMIHRDIKPENVLMTQDGILKVTDFGLVRGDNSHSALPAGGSSRTQQSHEAGLTQVGMWMGTEGYMAPEQAERAHEVDARADIFSFGVCLFEMFCGNRPYGITYGPRQEPPDPVYLSGDTKFPSGIAEVLIKAVQWEPSERLKSFSEIRQAFCGIYRDLFGEDSPYAELELLDLEADGLNNQGVSFFDLGRKEDAIAYWEMALSKASLNPEASYNLSLIQWRDAKIVDLEVLSRLDNCERNPAADKLKIAELKSLIHAERLDFTSSMEVLKDYPGRYEILFPYKNFRSAESVKSLEGHTGRVRSISITPDSRYAASGSYDGTVRVWELVSGRCVHKLEGHTDWVESVAVAPDSRHILSGSRDSTIKMWELQTGQCVRTLKGHTGNIYAIVFSPDGQYAVSASYDKMMRIWKLDTGQCVNTLRGHTSWIHSAAITADGRYVVSGGGDKIVRVWDLNNGRSTYAFKGHADQIKSIAISPDSRYAVSASKDKTLRVWDLRNGRCRHLLKGHRYEVNSVAISSDGRFVVSGSDDATLRMWELISGKCIRILKGHGFRGSVVSVHLNPDGRYAVSGSKDKTLRLWELSSGRCLRTIEDYSGEVTTVAFSPDGRYVVSGSWDKSIRIWKIMVESYRPVDLRVSLVKGYRERKQEEEKLTQSLNDVISLQKNEEHKKAALILHCAWKETGYKANKTINVLLSSLTKKGCRIGLAATFQKQLLKGHTDSVTSTAISSNGRYIVSGSVDNTLRVWEPQSGQCIHILRGHLNDVLKVAVSPDSKYAVSGSMDRTLQIWELESGSRVHTLLGHTKYVNLIAFSPDGRVAVSAGLDKTLRVWDIASGQCMNVLEGHTSGINSIATSLNGQYIVSGGFRTLRVWDLETGRCLKILKGHSSTRNHNSSINSIAVYPDGRYAVSGSSDKTLRIWELGSGQCLQTLKGHKNTITCVAISPDARYAVSGGFDKSLRIWELRSGRCVQTLEGHSEIIKLIIVSPDGRYAVSGGNDKGLRVWDLQRGLCLETLEGHTNHLNSISQSNDGRYVISGSRDKTVRVWEFIWDLEFPDPVDWDESVRPYLEIFLTLRNGEWTEDDFQGLVNELAEKRGYGWVRPEGIRKELEKMTDNWKP